MTALTTEQKTAALRADALSRLQALREADGMWRGHLSSSAISTSVSVFALHSIDAQRYAPQINKGVAWLKATMQADGSWGDSVESPSNMTATLLTYVSLVAVGEQASATRSYLNARFGGESEEALVSGVLGYYGKDLTFSVPILMMCALAGVVSDWRKIPPFPFELATLPQRLFRFLNLPVVSYAIPALIAIGICQMRQKGSFRRPLGELFVPKAMRVIAKMQPQDGGFLEAAPLTAFVSMCLAEGGFRAHFVTRRCADFLVETVRPDGSWPIDTNLSCWVTSLAAKVMPIEADVILRNQTSAVHPFTGAAPGGWGWSDLSGSVPDGDDTSAALVALHALSAPCDASICAGVRWLMGLQNHDGGMPTFAKGWGKLPFDRSSPDITAHALLAVGLWLPQLPEPLSGKARRSFDRMLRWLDYNQSDDGWTPLWFGDQDAPDEKAPVYGTATAVDYLMSIAKGWQQTQDEGLEARLEKVRCLAAAQLPFLLRSQNADGGWGGKQGVASKVTFTARAVAALRHFREGCASTMYGTSKIPTLSAGGNQPVGDLPVVTKEEIDSAYSRAIDFLFSRLQAGSLYAPEPIGLYFSRLWYSEQLYPIVFLLNALRETNQRA